MIFVTGGSGMVGSRLLANLVSDNKYEKILALKRKNSDLSLVENIFKSRFSNPDELLNKIQWVEGDLENFFEIEDVIEPLSDVYHVAALVSFQPADNEKLYQINLEGTRNLVDICLRKSVRKFCFVSSIAALGRGENDSIVDETVFRTSSKGSSVYSATKFESEMEVWRGIAEGLNAVIVNPSVILGSGLWNKGSSELINTVYKGLKFYTKGINGYVDADDVAKAMILLMESSKTGERYVLSAENWSYEKLFKTIAKYLKVKGPAYYANPLMGEIAWRLLWIFSLFTKKQPIITKATARNAKAVYQYSSEKIKNDMGFEFTTIENSIKTACKYYLMDLKIEEE